MIKQAALAVVVAAGLTLTGCGGSQRDSVTGKLISKEYEARNCEKWKGTTCKKWDPAEYELTIKETNGGGEVELVVTKTTYNRAVVGSTDTWTGVRD
jgi:hypothetical protein